METAERADVPTSLARVSALAGFVLACVGSCICGGVAFAALAIDLSYTLVAPSAYPAVFQLLFVSHRDRFLDHL